MTAQSPKLCQGRFRLAIRKNLFTERALRHRDRWPGRCWGPVPGKGRLDVALVDTAVFGRRRDSMTPETFPSLAEPGSGPASPGTPRPPAQPRPALGGGRRAQPQHFRVGAGRREGRALTSPEGPGAARRLFIVLAAAAAFCLCRRPRGRGGREGGKADSRTERAEPVRRRGRRQRQEGASGRRRRPGPLTRFRLSAAPARAASAPHAGAGAGQPGSAARERPWPTRTSSSTSSSGTQVGQPGRSGAGGGGEGPAPAPISAVLAVRAATWWLRAGKRRRLPPPCAGPARRSALSPMALGRGQPPPGLPQGCGAAGPCTALPAAAERGAQREKALSQRNLYLGSARGWQPCGSEATLHPAVL